MPGTMTAWRRGVRARTGSGAILRCSARWWPHELLCAST